MSRSSYRDPHCDMKLGAVHIRELEIQINATVLEELIYIFFETSWFYQRLLRCIFTLFRNKFSQGLENLYNKNRTLTYSSQNLLSIHFVVTVEFVGSCFSLADVRIDVKIRLYVRATRQEVIIIVSKTHAVSGILGQAYGNARLFSTRLSSRRTAGDALTYGAISCPCDKMWPTRNLTNLDALLQHERKHQHRSPWQKLSAGTLCKTPRPCKHYLLQSNSRFLILDGKKYHEWMSDVELRELTASEPLTLQEEYDMQRTRISQVLLGDLIFIQRLGKKIQIN